MLARLKLKNHPLSNRHETDQKKCDANSLDSAARHARGTDIQLIRNRKISRIRKLGENSNETGLSPSRPLRQRPTSFLSKCPQTGSVFCAHIWPEPVRHRAAAMLRALAKTFLTGRYLSASFPCVDRCGLLDRSGARDDLPRTGILIQRPAHAACSLVFRTRPNMTVRHQEPFAIVGLEHV